MRFYGQWTPPVDKILYEDYFPDKMDGTFIECGAFDGVLESCCKFFEAFRGWTGVNVEPVPHLYEMLCKNRPNSTNLKLALSDRNGTSTFTNVIHPKSGRFFGNGSLGHVKETSEQLRREGCKFEEFQVKTITYADLIRETGLENVDLFVLDVEGHEMQVIQGMQGVSVLPSVVCVEHGHLGGEIDVHLAKLGYKLSKRSHNNSFFVRS